MLGGVVEAVEDHVGQDFLERQAQITFDLGRQAVPPGIPLWQPILGVCLVLLTTALCVYAAGRIFRVGILMQGKGANPGQMLKWVIRG